MESLKYSEIQQLNKKLKAKESGPHIKVAVLSNVIVSSLKEPLEYILRRNGLNPEISIGNFDNIVQDSTIYSKADLVVIFYELLNIVEGLSGYIEAADDATIQELEVRLLSEIDLIMLNLKRTTKVVFNLFSTLAFFTGFTEGGRLTDLKESLNQKLKARTEKNLVLMNIDIVVAEVGLKETYDYRFYFSSKAPYSLQFFKKYLIALEPEIRKMSGKSKKALLLDCDNTLWKGVIGEDGMSGIDMSATSKYGKPFNDVQHIIKYLSANGVILALTSKNNIKEVEEVFLNHPDMVLKPEDIVVWKVNWNDKASNIRDLANELNIGLESMVFVDDSDFEINLIKEQIPQLVAFQVPKNSFEYKNAFMRMNWSYFNFAKSEEDKNKTRYYKEQFLRENEKQQFNTTEEYIQSLGIKVLLRLDDKQKFTRLAQLTQKTNQFNLTTRRYSEMEMEGFITNVNYHVFSGSVTDKFGESGITILVILSSVTGKYNEVEIDTFLMSCRIIGRKIEHAVLNEILYFLKSKGYSQVISYYLPTSKNEQVCHFYDYNGFKLIEEIDGKKQYKMNLIDYKYLTTQCLTIERDY